MSPVLRPPLPVLSRPTSSVSPGIIVMFIVGWRRAWRRRHGHVMMSPPHRTRGRRERVGAREDAGGGCRYGVRVRVGLEVRERGRRGESGREEILLCGRAGSRGTRGGGYGRGDGGHCVWIVNFTEVSGGKLGISETQVAFQKGTSNRELPIPSTRFTGYGGRRYPRARWRLSKSPERVWPIDTQRTQIREPQRGISTKCRRGYLRAMYRPEMSPKT
ncbi:hypothetical protein C8F04DRAFT_1121533 [Mycena alexandri]|uniref:Uncharacterized protein n=1 Tax=Mycena alexandri TaxID=1745969 RepID=A0AAD6SHR7_9AGAR|nr:hypothetical protein C8F04DRAFT_1121533 [Mycena alexandri]